MFCSSGNLLVYKFCNNCWLRWYNNNGDTTVMITVIQLMIQQRIITKLNILVWNRSHSVLIFFYPVTLICQLNYFFFLVTSILVRISSSPLLLLSIFLDIIHYLFFRPVILILSCPSFFDFPIISSTYLLVQLSTWYTMGLCRADWFPLGHPSPL